MSIPSWWSDSIIEPGDSAITIADVETGGVGIITETRLRLVTNGNWTEPSADLFKSPLDSAGRFFDILMTRIDADTLEFRVRDYLGNTLITRRMDINVGPATTVCEFYWGNNYLHIWARRATAESFFAYLLDPEAAGGTNAELANRLIAYAQRTSAGTPTTTTTGGGFAFDTGVATNDTRARSYYYVTAGSLTAFPGIAGRELYGPYDQYINQSSVSTVSGAAPGMMIGPNAIATDTVKNIPVDTGTKLAFIATPATVVASYADKALIRKPSVDP